MSGDIISCPVQIQSSFVQTAFCIKPPNARDFMKLYVFISTDNHVMIIIWLSLVFVQYIFYFFYLGINT